MFRSIQNVFGVMLFASFLVMAVGCAKTDPKPDPGPKEVKDAKGVKDVKDTKAPEEGPATNPEFKMTAEALAKEALNGDNKTLDKYKFKVIELEGNVANAGPNAANGNGFVLTGAKIKPDDIVELSIICIPSASEKEKTWWLGRGQKVKVVGRLVGANSISALAIALDRCVVTELEANPTPKVTAEALISEFVKDEAVAKKKYLLGGKDPKEVIVEGTVVTIETVKDNSTIKLGGKDGLTVRFSLNKETADALKKGDKVTIRGDLAGFYPGDKCASIDYASVLKKE